MWRISEGEEVFINQNSVLEFFKSYSGARASPPVLLEIGDDDWGDPPTVQEEGLPR